MVNGVDYLGLSARDTAMPVVPLFHANGWSFAFSAPMAGAALVLPGPKLDGASLAELLIKEKVTISAARADHLVLAAPASRGQR